MRRSVVERGLYEFLGVIDLSDDGQCKVAQMRAHQQRLRIVVRDAADPEIPLQVQHVPLELRAERGVLDVMDRAVETALAAVDRHARAPGAQMRVIVRSEEQIRHAILLRCYSEKTAHDRSSILLNYYLCIISCKFQNPKPALQSGRSRHFRSELHSSELRPPQPRQEDHDAHDEARHEHGP